MKRLFVLTFFGILFTAHVTRADTRTWTTISGRKMEAKYVSCHNGIVRMKNESGKTDSVPMWILSQKDQTFVIKTKGWAVVKAYRQANVKASLDVRLAERISKQKLTEIANELHGFANNKQPRLFIVYYLPDMQIDAGGWATSHFNPRLTLTILGASKEEYQRLMAKVTSTSPSEEIIGSWTVNILPNRIITFYSKSGKTYMRRRFKDGSGGEHELIIQKVGSQTRYRRKGGHPLDYFIITSNGDLGHCDDEGMWATSKRITSTSYRVLTWPI